MPNEEISIEFSSELKRFFQQAPEQFKKAAAKAMYQECELIMTDSKDNYCPVDTGALRDSGHVKPPEIKGDQISVEMGYGGAAADYAEKVHEDLKARHKVGQAKYLETPVNQAKTKFAERMSERIKKDMGL